MDILSIIDESTLHIKNRIKRNEMIKLMRLEALDEIISSRNGICSLDILIELLSPEYDICRSRLKFLFYYSSVSNKFYEFIYQYDIDKIHIDIIEYLKDINKEKLSDIETDNIMKNHKYGRPYCEFYKLV